MHQQRLIRRLGSCAVLAALAGCIDSSSVPEEPGIAIDVHVSPSAVTVTRDHVVDFSAALDNEPPGPATGVTWSLSGAGCTGDECRTLDVLGETSARYRAPDDVPADPNVLLTATSVADNRSYALASITVAQTAIEVSVVPASITVDADDTIQLVATVEHDPAHAGVTWSFGGICATFSCGTFSPVATASGEPTTLDPLPLFPRPTQPMYVIATSVTDPAWKAYVPLTIE